MQSAVRTTPGAGWPMRGGCSAPVCWARSPWACRRCAHWASADVGQPAVRGCAECGPLGRDRSDGGIYMRPGKGVPGRWRPTQTWGTPGCPSSGRRYPMGESRRGKHIWRRRTSCRSRILCPVQRQHPSHRTPWSLFQLPAQAGPFQGVLQLAVHERGVGGQAGLFKERKADPQTSNAC